MFWFYVYLVLSSLMVVVNTPLCVMIVLKQDLRRSKTNLMLLFLFLSHVLLGIFILSTSVLYLYYLNSKDFESLWALSSNVKVNSITAGICFDSFGSVIGVTVDRWIAIKYPFTYERLDRKFPMLFGFVTLVVSGGIYVMAIKMDTVVNQIRFNAVCIVTAVILLVANFNIRKVVQIQFKSIKKQFVNDNANEQRKNLRAKETKASRTCLTVALSFILFWSPYLVMQLLFSVINNLKYNLILSHVAGVCLSWMSFNSLFDPVIYVVLNKKLRRHLRITRSNAVHSSHKFPTMSRMKTMNLGKISTSVCWHILIWNVYGKINLMNTNLDLQKNPFIYLLLSWWVELLFETSLTLVHVFFLFMGLHAPPPFPHPLPHFLAKRTIFERMFFKPGENEKSLCELNQVWKISF